MLSEPSYLLFHTLAELFSVFVAFAVFVVGWNTRGFARAPFFLIVGVGFPVVGGFDLMHALSYKGMGLLAGDADLPTQWWVAARGVEAATVLLAVLLADRPLRPRTAASAALAAGLLIGGTIWLGVFPDCYVEGRGLTPFKIGAEYAFILVKAATLVALWGRARLLEPSVHHLLVAYLLVSALSEAAFTAYVGVYDGLNQLGHVLKVVAFVLIYRAAVRAALVAPYAVLFHDLAAARDRLEFVVADRTRELTQAKAQLDALFAASPLAVVALDAAGRVTQWNPSAERMFGRSAAEVVGGPPPAGLVVQADAEHAETELRRADGSRFWARGYGAPLVDFAGRADGLVVLLADVGRERDSRAALEALQEQLARVHRMEALGNLAGGIAHEVNNMLVPIVGLTELAQRRLEPDHPVQANLRGVMDAAGRAGEILRRILTFSRADRLVPGPTPLCGVLRDAVGLLAAATPKAVEIRLDLPEDELVVIGTPLELHQIVMNLGQNAIQAIGGRPGRIEVRVRRRDVAAGRPPAGGLTPGPHAVLDVCDDGDGIAPELMDKIFLPFFTTKGVGEGTGMGLSVVHGIVTGWRGAITVDSRPGEGTAFRMWLPLHAPAAAEPAPAQAAEASATSGSHSTASKMASTDSAILNGRSEMPE